MITLLHTAPAPLGEDSAAGMRQALRDLDILHILQAANPAFTENSAADFALRYFTGDADEIRARLACFGDLASRTDAARFECLTDALDRLKAEKEALSRADSRLTEVLYGRRRLSAYLAVVDTLAELLPAADYESPQLKALALYTASVREDEHFEECRKILAELEALITLPRYLHIGVNVKEDASPQEFGIVGVENEDCPVNALLAPRDLEKPANSLSPEFIYNSDLYGFHFDEYLQNALEKEWKNQLAKSKKLLDTLHIPGENDLLALRDDLEYYRVGLRIKALYDERGAALCRPEIGGNGFFAVNMKYPELLLHNPSIHGNDITLTNGDSEIITGANHSGKTSYLKTVGQGYLLAQFGFFVPAEKLSVSPVERIYTLFSAGEDDSMDASRMGIEIHKITDIMKNAGPKELVLLNEPLTSTNPVEAVSICADLSRKFLAGGITHLMVTHLYDVYFLLNATLPESSRARLHSLITESHFDSESESMVHRYKIREAEPEGNSYARATAVSYGITLEAMLPDDTQAYEAKRYLDSLSSNTLYSRES